MSLFGAVQLLTVAPAPFASSVAARDRRWAPIWFPAVGLALGAAIAGIDRLLGLALPAGPRSALVLLALAMFTGFLHLDGLMDTFDGAFAFRSREERLEIMRDPRVGAFGVAGGVLVLLAKFSTFAALPEASRWGALLAAPAVSRWTASLAISVWPYARSAGAGSPYMGGNRILKAAAAGAMTLAGAYLIGGLGALAALGVATAVSIAVGAFLRSRLGGLTGDCYGAIVEISEMAYPAALIAAATLRGA